MNLFPHEKIRNEQKIMAGDITSAVENGKVILAHAPTGTGKTAASLAPTIEYALKNKKTVLFLTSRITQHKIVVDTVNKMNERHGKNIRLCDFISKQRMCLQPIAQEMYSSEFSSFCNDIIKEGNCRFYNKVWKEKENARELSAGAKLVVGSLIANPSFSSVIKESKKSEMCPYEINAQIAKRANIVIGDYYHLFSPSVRQSFLRRINKELSDLIVIVDEAHNLPTRLQELLSARITDIALKRAAREAEHEKMQSVKNIIIGIKNSLESFKSNEEIMLSREVFIRKVETETGKEFDDIIEELEESGEEIRKKRNRSSVNALYYFLESWDQRGDEFVRTVKTEDGRIVLTKHCMDPSRLSKEVFGQIHSAVLMSGTLTPIKMYADLLDIDTPILREYSNPFPEENRMNIVMPVTSTKYSRRSEGNYQQISDIISGIVNTSNVNSIIFFPSYNFMGEIYKRIEGKLNSKIVLEQRGMDAEGRGEILSEFKNLENTCLFAVLGGSFSEGIDLPGRQLELVVVVGIPLERPTLEVKSRIAYYDKKFGKGWDYAYTYPAINRAQQAAGRCIRTKTDRGAIVFLDERYAWERYLSLFPKDWNTKISSNPAMALQDFFRK